MEEIRLLRPTMEYDEEIMTFRREIAETDGEDAFAGCGCLRHCTTTQQWLDQLAQYETEATCPKGSVPSNTYLAVRMSDRRVVGIIDLRHHIDHPILSVWVDTWGIPCVPRNEEKATRRKCYAKI